MSRTLVLIRHAKASEFGQDDHGRALTPRGLADAAQAGQLLAERELVPDQLVVSTAVRTQQTAEAISAAAGWDTPFWSDSTLYEAGPDAIFEILHALDEEAQVAVLVAHNPGVSMVAQLLDDGTGQLVEPMATAGVAIFEIDGAWNDVEPASARIRELFTARA